LLQETLHTQLRAIRRGFVVPDRQRLIVWDVTANGSLINGQDLDTFLAQAGQILVSSGRVYKWEDTLVFEFREGAAEGLLLLAVRGKPETNAASVLANLFCIGAESERGASQSLVPAKLVNALLADEGLWQKLPAITTYARRAVFDENFVLRGPGWHPGQGILVHGPDIVPADLPPVVPAVLPPAAPADSADRLPPYLRRLLREFCWAGAADLENALGMVLSGLLLNHFVADPKPIMLIDGNQPEVGKTQLAQVVGLVLDGREPERIAMTKDEELEKKVGAKLRESKSSLLFFDNLRAKVDSAFIEANALSPLLSVRLLGHSRNINRPNSYLWCMTSNLTSGSTDLISRGVAVRLRYEGDPVKRTFTEDLPQYAARHRLDILGELAAMVLRWVEANTPKASDIWPANRPRPRHRCQKWAQLIGGILGANGFFNFLANAEEARADMDEGLQALATLAEHVVAKSLGGYINPPEADPSRGKLPREWAQLFVAAGLFKDKLTALPVRGLHTWVGNFLLARTDSAVTISAGASSGTAVLRRNKVRSDQKRYYFEVTPATSADYPAPPPGGAPGGNGHAAAPAVAAAPAHAAGGPGDGAAGLTGGPPAPAGADGPVNAQGEVEWL
jgi:hypothetical protein